MDGLQRLEATVSGGDDGVWVGTPDEGFRGWLCSAMNRLMAAWRSARERKTPRCKRLLATLAKKPSSAFSPGQMQSICRGEAEVGVSGRPSVDGGRANAAPSRACGLSMMAWTSLLAGNRRLDDVEEADELLMPMALHVAADHGAVEHVESGGQRRRDGQQQIEPREEPAGKGVCHRTVRQTEWTERNHVPSNSILRALMLRHLQPLFPSAHLSSPAGALIHSDPNEPGRRADSVRRAGPAGRAARRPAG